jgi:hypothetical protein
MNAFHKSQLKPWGLALVEKYPLIFLDNPSVRNEYKIDQSEFVSLRYGFEHDEGWSKLIDKLAATGTMLVTHLRANGFPDASINSFICKAKFGTLRWQGDSHLPEPFGRFWQVYVAEIEMESANTCEITGRNGQPCISDRGWVKILCEEEAKKLGYKQCEK